MVPYTCRKRGFTLIEIMVVIAIIGVLAAVVTMNISDARKKARDAQRISDLQQIQLALKLYAHENNGYPKESQVGQDLGFFDGVIGGSPYDPDLLIQPFMPGPVRDPLHDGIEYFYYYDGFHECTKEDNDDPVGELDMVIFAHTMEHAGGANWSTVCDENDSEPNGNPPDADSYVIRIPGLQTF